MAITNASLTTGEIDIYTSVADIAVTVIYLCNYSVGAVTVDVHIRPGGETLGTDNEIYSAIAIPAGDTFVASTEKLVLATGDIITAVCSANTSVTATVSTLVI
jgi:hypothetical protein